MFPSGPHKNHNRGWPGEGPEVQQSMSQSCHIYSFYLQKSLKVTRSNFAQRIVAFSEKQREKQRAFGWMLLTTLIT